MNQDKILEIPEIDIKLDYFPKISVCIVTKDNTDQLFDCINSLLKTSYPLENIELLICDTGSNFDSKLKMKRYFSKFINMYDMSFYIKHRVFYNKKYNYSANNNFLVKNSSIDTELLLLLNNDVEFINDNLIQYISLYNTQRDKNFIGTIGSQLIYQSQQIQHNGIFITKNVYGQYLIGHNDQFTQHYKEGVTENIGNTAASMLIRKDLFLDIGGFDETFNLFQDVKLNLECIKRGKSNYTIHSAIAYHYESQSRHLNDLKIIEDQFNLKKDLGRMQLYLNNNFEHLKHLIYGVK